MKTNAITFVHYNEEKKSIQAPDLRQTKTEPGGVKLI